METLTEPTGFNPFVAARGAGQQGPGSALQELSWHNSTACHYLCRIGGEKVVQPNGSPLCACSVQISRCMGEFLCSHEYMQSPLPRHAGHIYGHHRFACWLTSIRSAQSASVLGHVSKHRVIACASILTRQQPRQLSMDGIWRKCSITWCDIALLPVLLSGSHIHRGGTYLWLFMAHCLLPCLVIQPLPALFKTCSIVTLQPVMYADKNIFLRRASFWPSSRVPPAFKVLGDVSELGCQSQHELQQGKVRWLQAESPESPLRFSRSSRMLETGQSSMQPATCFLQEVRERG